MEHYVMTVLAVLPAAVLLYFIYKEDKVEKEPFGLLAKIFGFGVLSTAIASVLEYVGQVVLMLLFKGDTNNWAYIFLLFFFVVGLSEEFVKYMVVKIVAWKDKEFNYTFDAVVYCVFSSLGFAALENIKYLWDAGYANATVRAILSVPGHAIFAVFMGMYIGFAKYCEGQGNIPAMKTNLRKALIIPTLIHGAYDFLLSIDGLVPSAIPIVIFFAFEISITIVAFKKIKFLSSGDTAIFQNYYNYLWESKKNAQKEQIRQMQYNQQMQQQYGQIPGLTNNTGNQNPQLGTQATATPNLQIGQNNNYQQAQNMNWKPAQGGQQYIGTMANQNAQIQQPANNNNTWQANQNNNYQQAQNMNWKPAANAYQQQVMQNKDLSAQPANTFNPAQQPTASWQPNQNNNFQQAQSQVQAPVQPQTPVQPQAPVQSQTPVQPQPFVQPQTPVQPQAPVQPVMNEQINNQSFNPQV